MKRPNEVRQIDLGAQLVEDVDGTVWAVPA